MSETQIRRVGWCPGALRPMAAGDGWLARVKPRGNRLSITQARGIAAASRRFGNGVLSLTGRANLQIRGLRAVALPEAVAALEALDLLDADAAAEAARNVVTSPMAGLTNASDIRPAVVALEAALIRDEMFRGLPAKFAWTVDDGGPLDLSSIGGDVLFTAIDSPRGAVFRIDLAGGGTATCGPAALVEAASALTGAFLALCDESTIAPHRMRDLVASLGAGPILRRAGLPAGAPPLPPRPTPRSVGSLEAGAVGIAPPFGRLEADRLDAIAETAGDAGSHEIRLTPWRGLILPGAADPEVLLRALAACGMIVDPADPRLAIVACAGQPACARAGAPVQADATALAPLVGPTAGATPRLHLSGCAKGCAHPGRAGLTAVARDGLYDIMGEGHPGDAPTATGLPLAALAALLAERTQGRETV